ncbi:MAG TPA: hypothetical protein PKA00_11480 [Saprospiraceae bacterium]|nr:hypothetical protein [Saprospiraceae bacterium]HMQ83524.1 hypothetical protein [Saprospiraceae bacterium]
MRKKGINEPLDQALPSSLLRLGSIIIFGCLLILLFVLWVLNYTEEVNGTIVVLPESQIREIYSQGKGQIKFFAKNNEKVNQGDLLAYIEEGVNKEDFIELSILAYAIPPDSSISAMIPYLERLSQIYQSLSLGVLHDHLQPVIYQYYRYQDFVAAKSPLSVQLIKSKQERVNYYKSRIDLFKQKADFYDQIIALAEKKKAINAQLFNEKAASVFDVDASELEYLTEINSDIDNEIDVNSIRVFTSVAEQDLLVVEMAYFQELRQYHTDIKAAIDYLKQELAAWEQKHLLKASIGGIFVRDEAFFHTDKYVDAGTFLGMIYEKDLASSDYIGDLKLAEQYLADIRIGQNIHISFDAYSALEYGVFQGYIDGIDPIPSDGFFHARVRFPANMQSTYGKEISWTPNLNGKARVVVKENVLFYRFENTIKSWLLN